MSCGSWVAQMSLRDLVYSQLVMQHSGEDSGIWVLLSLLFVYPGAMYLTSLNAASLICETGIAILAVIRVTVRIQ